MTDCCGERILNPDTGSYTQLPTFYPDLGLFLPCVIWSPDAARLACEGFGDVPALDGVYTINSLDGGDVKRVTSGGDDDCPGDYSPNGKRLVFLRASFELGVEGLYVVKTDGTDLRPLTPAGMDLNFNCGSWSPQGNEILFSAHSPRERGARSSPSTPTVAAFGRSRSPGAEARRGASNRSGRPMGRRSPSRCSCRRPDRRTSTRSTPMAPASTRSPRQGRAQGSRTGARIRSLGSASMPARARHARPGPERGAPGRPSITPRNAAEEHLTRHSEARAVSSGASRTRTGDLLGAIQALSQLSYSPARASV